MANTLKQHFPIIRDRSEVLEEIRNSEELSEEFEKWEDKAKGEFLDFCTGVRGVKLLYDAFFKEIMNPDATPERLEELLSLLLKTKVKILKVLPNDSSRIAAENSLLILDSIVELGDGSIANVEAQRIGYNFPGQRCACYSSDLLLRQYKRVRGEKGKSFSYRDIKKVYTIVFFEKSTPEFHKFSDVYLHRSKQTADTGVQIDLLQEYIFIALDIFGKKIDNKSENIKNKLEAWLVFLSMDEPEMILHLIECYPEFKLLYQEVYEMCRNMECMMRIFSKELEILDRNTVQYMIDEMQEQIDEQKEQIDEQKKQIEKLQAEIKKLESEKIQ